MYRGCDSNAELCTAGGAGVLPGGRMELLEVREAVLLSPDEPPC